MLRNATYLTVLTVACAAIVLTHNPTARETISLDQGHHQLTLIANRGGFSRGKSGGNRGSSSSNRGSSSSNRFQSNRGSSSSTRQLKSNSNSSSRFGKTSSSSNSRLSKQSSLIRRPSSLTKKPSSSIKQPSSLTKRPSSLIKRPSSLTNSSKDKGSNSKFNFQRLNKNSKLGGLNANKDSKSNGLKNLGKIAKPDNNNLLSKFKNKFGDKLNQNKLGDKSNQNKFGGKFNNNKFGDKLNKSLLGNKFGNFNQFKKLDNAKKFKCFNVFKSQKCFKNFNPHHHHHHNHCPPQWYHCNGGYAPCPSVTVWLPGCAPVVEEIIELPKMLEGDILTLGGKALGPDVGEVQLRIGAIKLGCQLLAWDDEQFTMIVPFMELKSPVAAELRVLYANGSLAYAMDVEVFPGKPVVLPEAEVTDAELTTFAEGDSASLGGVAMGDEPGRVMLKVEGVSIECQLQEWKSDYCLAVIPEMGLEVSTVVQMVVLNAAGEQLISMDITVVPGQPQAEAQIDDDAGVAPVEDSSALDAVKLFLDA